jgi:hypothetical protein
MPINTAGIAAARSQAAQFDRSPLGQNQERFFITAREDNKQTDELSARTKRNHSKAGVRFNRGVVWARDNL